ncbi:MAG: citrate/2-methylcitrate synthase [Clostridia bacterium]|nr:citrate/2-methylcitrate synthase [Clostridia bacterium]
MNKKRDYSEITPALSKLGDLLYEENVIDPALYSQHKVNRGLRDINGKGVLTGLTEISEVLSRKVVDGEEVPCDGELYYRGYNVHDLINDFIADRRFGFEETTYILLFGKLPTKDELEEFKDILSDYRSLPNSFVRDFIMKSPSSDMMNSLARSVLALYSYDNNPDDTSINNVLRQCLHLIALFPQLAVYSYRAYDYYRKESSSFFIHMPKREYSTAENILYMLRPDGQFTPLEAEILDIALVLHAEHGGGNNSSFTTHVVTSSGTDTYSAIAAALGSLKGPKHGGANIKVCSMFENIKENVSDWSDREQIADCLDKIVSKQAFDKTGLVYGIGHAIYSISDPRATIFRGYVERLAQEKGRSDEFELYKSVEELAPQIIAKHRNMYKGVSANVDFYSGFVYQMLGLPQELYTPIFAIARISGWSAHRLEELINGNKIIRPAYKSVSGRREYKNLKDR